MSKARLLRVLIVDDSAYVRKVVSQLLSHSPFLDVVGTARNGQETLDRVIELEPNVITYDLIIPNLNGVGFVREQMARKPMPIVIVNVASESGELVLAALDADAVDVVQKPTALASKRLLEISEDLIAKMKAATNAHLRHPPLNPTIETTPMPLGAKDVFDIVVLGISTENPQTLRALIPRLPTALSMPLAMILHMPVGYTELYARKLNELSSLHVVKATNGLQVQPETVLIAPTDRHLSIRRGVDDSVSTHLNVRPLNTPHRPSVDVLFQSAADVYAGRILEIVMTNMGSDRHESAAWIKAKKNRVLTESEETCIVYGIPHSVVKTKLSDQSVELDEMADAILEQL